MFDLKGTKKEAPTRHGQATSGKTFANMKSKNMLKSSVSSEDAAKLLLSEDMGKDLRSGRAPEVSPKEKRVVPRFALIPEDVPIDLGVIATRIKVPPYCRIINAALEPLRQVLKVAALLAKVLGEIFGAIVFALVALLEIFERALIPIAQICLVSLAAFLAKGGIFFDFIERAFAHAALAIPLLGVVLVILEHEFRL